MSDQAELLEHVKRLVKSQQKLTARLQEFTEATMALSAGVHALADALASAATDAVEDEPQQAAASVVERYADGSPVGG